MTGNKVIIIYTFQQKITEAKEMSGVSMNNIRRTKITYLFI